MKQHLYSFATWINADPRRFRLLTLSLSSSLALLAVFMPGLPTINGWAAGGSD